MMNSRMRAAVCALAVGTPANVAKGLKAALDQTNYQRVR